MVEVVMAWMTVLVVMVMLLWYESKGKGKRLNAKEPRRWPVIGSAVEQLLNYHRMHDWILSYLSNSTTVVVRMPFRSHYTYTVDPANVEYILKTNFSNFPKGESYQYYMKELLGDGIFNADGEAWRSQRKTASFEFASRNLREFSTLVFREYAVKLARILSRTCCLYQQYVDMQEMFMRMTLDSICKVGFGVEIGSLDLQMPENRFAKAFDTANAVVTLRFIDPLWRLKRFFGIGSEALLDNSIRVLDHFTYSLIRRRKAHFQAKPDLLSRFIELSSDPENNLSEKNLRDIVLNFLIAGRDTTAATLSWFVYMMICHPAVADRLHSDLTHFEQKMTDAQQNPPQEFNDRISHFATLLNYDSLTKLPYLHAAITETLRLYPAVPQDPKGILQDDTLPDGTELKKGGMVTYVPYSMGRMKQLWGNDALEFRPERWLIDGLFQNVSPFKFTAFQAGPRVCLGKDSAYLQMKMTAAILCRFFKFELVPGHPVKYRMMTILSMAHGLRVSVSPRF